MKVDVLLGLQWGDEGKGKVVDVLTPKYDVIIETRKRDMPPITYPASSFHFLFSIFLKLLFVCPLFTQTR